MDKGHIIPLKNFTFQSFNICFLKNSMAKKEVIKVEKELVANVDPLKLTVTEDKFSHLSLMELIYAEKAAKIICQRYENSIKNYDGSIAHNSVEYNKFKQFNNLHQEILDKIEEILLKLE